MTDLRVELPFPPSVNHYYRTFRGRILISKTGREYRQSVYAATLEQLGLFPPFKTPLKAVVELTPPDKRRRDLDNFAGKALYDALQHANLYLDDSQIKEMHHYMLPPGEAKCVVLLSEIE